MNLTNDQVEALSSSRRTEILDDLRTSGSASIGELARRLDCSPKALYHHMRLLQEVGLVQVKGIRQGKRREEAVYAPVTQGPLTANDRSEAQSKARAKMTNSLMRATAKAYNRAQAELPEGDPRLMCTMIARSLARLSTAEATKVAVELKRLVEAAREQSDPSAEDKYSVVVSIVPLL